MGYSLINSLLWGYMPRGISMTDAAAVRRACPCVFALPKAYARKRKRQTMRHACPCVLALPKAYARKSNVKNNAPCSTLRYSKFQG